MCCADYVDQQVNSCPKLYLSASVGWKGHPNTDSSVYMMYIHAGGWKQDAEMDGEASKGRLLCLQVTIFDKPCVLINLHIPGANKREERVIFMQALKKALARSAGMDLVVGGDFNGVLDEHDIIPRPKTSDKRITEHKQVTELLDSYCATDAWRHVRGLSCPIKGPVPTFTHKYIQTKKGIRIRKRCFYRKKTSSYKGKTSLYNRKPRTVRWTKSRCKWKCHGGSRLDTFALTPEIVDRVVPNSMEHVLGYPGNSAPPRYLQLAPAKCLSQSLTVISPPVADTMSLLTI